MSQEQPPIRSRRELRRAREQHLEQTPLEHVAGAGTAAAAAPAEAPKKSGPETGRVRRVADAPVDATPGAERSSQIRARDRAALRAIKELADKEGQLSKGGPPTRRQLRLQQLQEELAPGTSMLPVVAPPAGAAPAGSAPSADAPASALPVVPQAAPGGRPAQSGPYRTAPDGAIRVTAGPPASAAEPAAAEPPAARPEMSVEQALAARELLTAQAQNQANKLEHIASLENASGDSADAQEAPEDQQALARQIAEAEREAILSKRAEAKQKLAEQTARPAAAKSGPATANNLAMVTPLEFVKVPGVERPMMKPPATSFVPLVTSAGPKLSKDQAAAAKQRSKRGRAAVLARAEAAAKAARSRTAEDAVVDSEGASPAAPVAARAAYGLDPLDAATAGLARARRQRLLILCLAVVAAAAVIAGIVFIASGISR
ncbi:hypothetical protein [Arthrobacter celericrescens]|uniref:hypothetical protein n=1 Tax=Arthrobacter celericrescens TaxID=2320851 RepID=UPI000EA2BC59|nr:hypothetical protein [Arthrobacter celericrescens]